VADDGDDLACIQRGADEVLDALVAPEGHHRRLPADEEDRVEGGEVEIGEGGGVLDHRRVGGAGDEPPGDEIAGRVAGGVPGSENESACRVPPSGLARVTS
jgi:hypothetical protein